MSLILAETRVVKVAVSAPSVEAIQVRDGDLNGDGVVNILDISIIANSFGSYPSHMRWNPKADLNSDNSVSIIDVALTAREFGKSCAPRKKRTHIIAYISTITDATAAFIASNFDLVITRFEPASIFSKIKALKTDIIVLCYKDIMGMHSHYDDWEEVNTHEDWFIHDINGNRLVNKFWGWYCMDVGNQGWRNHYAAWVKSMLDRYPMVDGVFADDVWNTFFAGSGWNPWTVPIEDVPIEIRDRWHVDMVGMISFVKSTIGSKLLIVNTSNNDDYVDACDGKMEEGFVHPSRYTLDEFHDDYIDWKGKVDSLKEISQSGKYYLAQSGTVIPENPTEAELDKVHEMMIYCFGSYLLGVNGEKTTFGFNNIYSQDGSRGYYSEFDVSLGSPINEYYSTGSVYARDFGEGKILVNPTTSPYTVNLDAEYETLDGQKVSSILLNAHSGAILFAL